MMSANVLEEIRKTVAERLDKGDAKGTTIDGVVALCKSSDGIAPHVFQKGDDLSGLNVDPKYPVMTLVSKLHKRFPAIRLGVVARGCDERAFIEMGKRNQIDPNRLVILGFACTAEEAQACYCASPAPTSAHLLVGTPPAPGPANPVVEKYDAMPQAERRAFWKGQFLKCIKCYGCRNICPQCFCNICALEDETWVQTGRLPMQNPSMYHLVRAMHMTAKCVACRECEETCPAGIPMAVHFRLIARDVKEMFNYETGAVMEQKPPQLLVLEEGEFERTGLPH